MNFKIKYRDFKEFLCLKKEILSYPFGTTKECIFSWSQVRNSLVEKFDVNWNQF